ncbi:VTT domain-containing protein [Parvularcula maris]|uniref:VTT domain-containing protein n=1 Tax=Parvularcula maris TaxID=2965077 RepID=A0A9X2L7F4_9PROT|nr:VTT domain-containing protein [Parvularcula maris]MCQ8184465.1 VTT domain-containing protein [Parvularcula maris]
MPEMPEVMHAAETMMHEHMWAVYLGIFFGPFLQEDAAVLSSTSLAASSMMGSVPLILGLALAGLCLSDMWKYGLGTLGQRWSVARRMAESKHVRSAGEVVQERLGSAIFAARFLPGARIPLYIAAGYFKAGFLRFAGFIVASAAFLILLLYAVLKLLGEVAGDKAVFIVSLGAISALLLLILVRVVKARLAKGREASVAEMG